MTDTILYSPLTVRRQAALDRVLEAIHSDRPAIRLSDVIFDAKSDYNDETKEWEDFGFDCDDLADVLLPVLQAFFVRQAAARG